MNAKDDYFHWFLRINLRNFHDFPCFFFSRGKFLLVGFLSTWNHFYSLLLKRIRLRHSTNKNYFHQTRVSHTYKSKKSRMPRTFLEPTVDYKRLNWMHSESEITGTGTFIGMKVNRAKGSALTTQTEKNEPGNCFCNYTWCFSLESLLLSITILYFQIQSVFLFTHIVSASIKISLDECFVHTFHYVQSIFNEKSRTYLLQAKWMRCH